MGNAMTEQIKIDGQLFRAASVCVSKEETRYYLCGVYVQPHVDGGALLIATDGHRMFVARDPNAVCTKSAIVSLDKEAHLSLARALKVGDVSISITNEGIASFATYLGAKSTFIDGTFPDWPRVLRPILELAKKRFHGKPVYDVASFNGDHLGSFGKISALLTPSASVAIRLVSFSEGDPALILFPNEPNAFGVLMPMRTTNPESALPAFMKAVLDPPAPKSIHRKPADAKKPKRKAA